MRLSPEKEIWVRGKSVFSGYYRDPEKTKESFEDGWFKTGDLGELDRDGFLYFRGRKKEMIVTASGLNVYPQDIEAILNATSGIKEGCVIETKRGDQSVIHAVLLLEDSSRDPKSLIEQANARLEEHQKIQEFSVWPLEDFPRTTTLKVKKNEVVRRLEEWRKGTLKPAEEEGKRPPLYEFLAQLSGLGTSQIHPESRLGDDLGLSSLDRVQLAAMIEEQYHFDVDETFLTSQSCVTEIEELIQKRAAAAEEKELPRWPAHPFFVFLRGMLQELFIFLPLRLFCRLDVSGTDIFRALKGPFIFVANHTSYFDVPVILAALPSSIRRKTAIATWKEYFDVQGLSLGSRLFKYFAYYFTLLFFNSFLFPQQKGFTKSFE
jgi:long-chain acyl-CoA synthetase